MARHRYQNLLCCVVLLATLRRSVSRSLISMVFLEINIRVGSTLDSYPRVTSTCWIIQLSSSERPYLHITLTRRSFNMRNSSTSRGGRSLTNCVSAARKHAFKSSRKHSAQLSPRWTGPACLLPDWHASCAMPNRTRVILFLPDGTEALPVWGASVHMTSSSQFSKQTISLSWTKALTTWLPGASTVCGTVWCLVSSRNSFEPLSTPAAVLW